MPSIKFSCFRSCITWWMASKPMFWGPSLFLSSGNWITWMSVCHIHIHIYIHTHTHTYICLTPGRIHGSPHEGSNWNMIEYEYPEQRQLHIKLGLVSCKHQHVNQTAIRAKHSEDLTLPINPNNPNWLLPNHQPRVRAGIYIWRRLTSKLFSPLMLRREMVLDTLAYLQLNRVMWQLV